MKRRKKQWFLKYLTFATPHQLMLKCVDKFLNKRIEICIERYDFAYIGMLF